MIPRPDQDPTTPDASPLRVELPILTSSPVFWRSLGELTDAPASPASQGHGPEIDSHQQLVELTAMGADPSSRREFLRLMAASMALGSLSGCAIEPSESIVPYVEAPEQIVPGKPLFFTTAIPTDGFACGVLVESHMGRPTKIEGNPDHPASLGATDAFAQATILSFYDPDRSQVVTHESRVDTWEHVESVLLGVREAKRPIKGAGLRFLTTVVTSPTLGDQLRRLVEQFPEAKWHSYEPITRDAVRAGCRLAFGEELEPVYHLDKADVIVALDADFLAWGPGRLKDARAFAARREPEKDQRLLHQRPCRGGHQPGIGDHESAVCDRVHSDHYRELERSPIARGRPRRRRDRSGRRRFARGRGDLDARRSHPHRRPRRARQVDRRDVARPQGRRCQGFGHRR